MISLFFTYSLYSFAKAEEPNKPSSSLSNNTKHTSSLKSSGNLMADSMIVMIPLVLSFAVCLFAFPNNIQIIIINHEIEEAILSSIFLNRPIQTNN